MWPIFLTVFLAELGDKTQLATLAFTTQNGSGSIGPWQVFLASAGALVCSSAVAVLVGHFGSQWLSNLPLKLISGIVFLVLGGWTIWDWSQQQHITP